MLPRKGIDTQNPQPSSPGSSALRCKRCFPVRGLIPLANLDPSEADTQLLQEMLPRKGIDTRALREYAETGRIAELQEMLPRKGIDTPAVFRPPKGVPGTSCKRCFPVRGLIHRKGDRSRPAFAMLQEMLPRKGIDTVQDGKSTFFQKASCKRCFPVRGLILGRVSRKLGGLPTAPVARDASP